LLQFLGWSVRIGWLWAGIPLPYTSLFRSRELRGLRVRVDRARSDPAHRPDVPRQRLGPALHRVDGGRGLRDARALPPGGAALPRSEEHTSELQSRSDLVCRLLLEKKNRES